MAGTLKHRHLTAEEMHVRHVCLTTRCGKYLAYGRWADWARCTREPHGADGAELESAIRWSLEVMVMTQEIKNCRAGIGGYEISQTDLSSPKSIIRRCHTLTLKPTPQAC